MSLSSAVLNYRQTHKNTPFLLGPLSPNYPFVLGLWGGLLYIIIVKIATIVTIMSWNIDNLCNYFSMSYSRLLLIPLVCLKHCVNREVWSLIWIKCSGISLNTWFGLCFGGIPWITTYIGLIPRFRLHRRKSFKLTHLAVLLAFELACWLVVAAPHLFREGILSSTTADGPLLAWRMCFKGVITDERRLFFKALMEGMRGNYCNRLHRSKM